jgi:hypothetical protein
LVFFSFHKVCGGEAIIHCREISGRGASHVEGKCLDEDGGVRRRMDL